MAAQTLSGAEWITNPKTGPAPSAELTAFAKAAGQAWARKLQITPEEERLENGAYFAMQTFFGAARRVDGVNKVAQEVMDLPSAWSVISHFGGSA